MRALRMLGGKPTIDPQAETPTLAPGEALVRIRRASITSVEALAGLSAASEGRTLGHEAVGIVEHIDHAGRPDWKQLEHARVAIHPVVSCAACPLCRAGLAWHCPSRRVIGLSTAQGALADRLVVPARNLIPIPNTLDDDKACLAVTVGAALQLTHAVRVEGKTFVTVLGDGPIGLLAAQLLARRNASVRLLGRHPERFSLCERWGIRHRHESEAGRRADQTIVLDCTGSPAGLGLAARLVRPRGTVVIKGPPTGFTRDGVWPADLMTLIDREVALLPCSSTNIREGLDAIASGSVDLDPLLGRRLRLDQAPDAIALVRQRSILRAIVEVDRPNAA